MKVNGVWIIKNLIRIVVLLTLVSAAAFFLVSVSPLDPLKTNVGQAALGSMSPVQIAKLEEYWGVNTPPVARFMAWAGDFLRGDMGVSLLYRQPVSRVIAVKLSNSLWLMAVAWMVSGLVGILLGVVAGANRGRTVDRVISGYALITASTPAFWLALVLLMVFAVWLKVLPIGLSVPIGVEASGVTLGDRIVHAILPALTLSITGISNIAMPVSYTHLKSTQEREGSKEINAAVRKTKIKRSIRITIPGRYRRPQGCVSRFLVFFCGLGTQLPNARAIGQACGESIDSGCVAKNETRHNWEEM